MGTGILSLGQSGRDLKLTTHVHLLPSFRMSVAIQEQFLPSLFYVLRVEGTEQFGVAVTQQACVQEATVSE